MILSNKYNLLFIFCSTFYVRKLSIAVNWNWLWPHADKNVGDDNEKSAAQFEALEKGDPSPEKEMIKARAPLSKFA